MDQFEFYKELYYKELEAKEQISNSLNTPLAIISGLVTGIYILATTFSYETSRASKMVFLIFLLLSLFPLGCSVVNLCLAFIDKEALFEWKKPFQYKALSKSTGILAWENELKNFYSEDCEDQDQIDRLVNEEFKKGMILQMCEFTDINIKRNESKNAYIFRSKVLIIYSLILAFLTVFPYGYSMVNKPVKAENIENVSELGKSSKTQTDSLIKNKNNVQYKRKSQTVATATATDTAATAARTGNKRMGGTKTNETK